MKRNKVIFWTATVLIFLIEGVMPLATLLFSPENFNVGTKPLGYPDYFAYTLIFLKIIGSVALMTPNLNSKLIEWTYAGFTFNLIFAVISHIVVDQNIGFILFPVIVGAILAVSYIFRQKIKEAH